MPAAPSNRFSMLLIRRLLSLLLRFQRAPRIAAIIDTLSYTLLFSPPVAAFSSFRFFRVAPLDAALDASFFFDVEEQLSVYFVITPPLFSLPRRRADAEFTHFASRRFAGCRYAY